MPYINGVYIAQVVDGEKMLDALKDMRTEAHERHIANVNAEQKRYEQELKDIERFIAMFYCSNYEMEGAEDGK